MMNVGDKVVCLSGSIDRREGKGEIGYVTGFARLSKHHPREVFVSPTHPDSKFRSSATWGGWFWECDVKPA